jgi:hypothetical protein
MLVALTALLLFLLSPSAQAQRCGAYWVRVSVTGESGTAPEGASVFVTPELKVRWEPPKFTADAAAPGLFTLTLSEHDLVKGEYELHVKAPKFKAYSQKISFPHCQTQVIKVKLEKDRERPSRRRRRRVGQKGQRA